MRGDPLAVCDRCPRQVHLRELSKEWTGLMVCDECWDPKPVDLRPRRLGPEGMPYRNARPEPEPLFIDPLNPVTGDDL